jgi:hypothetical protein
VRQPGLNAVNLFVPILEDQQLLNRLKHFVLNFLGFNELKWYPRVQCKSMHGSKNAQSSASAHRLRPRDLQPASASERAETKRWTCGLPNDGAA